MVIKIKFYLNSSRLQVPMENRNHIKENVFPVFRIFLPSQARETISWAWARGRLGSRSLPQSFYQKGYTGGARDMTETRCSGSPGWSLTASQPPPRSPLYVGS